jgi:hypothetical protein
MADRKLRYQVSHSDIAEVYLSSLRFSISVVDANVFLVLCLSKMWVINS